MKTLIILSHFDDETFSLLGYIQNLINTGNNVWVHYMCKGRNTENHEKRLKVLNEISDKFKFPFSYLNNYDLNLDLVNICDLSNEILKLLKEYMPDRVITHYSDDLHQDHCKTSRCTKIALKHWNCNELLEVKSPDNYQFSNPYFDSVYHLNDKEFELKQEYALKYKETENVPKIERSEYFKTIFRVL